MKNGDGESSVNVPLIEQLLNVPGSLLGMDQDRHIWQIIVEVVEVLMIHHRLMAFVLLRMVCGIQIIRNIRYHYHPRNP